MKYQIAKLAAVVVMIAGIAACSHPPGRAGDGDDLNAVTRVRVENQAFLDMNIFVLSESGNRRRLGTVTGNSNQTFVIPPDIIGPANSVRFLAEPIGSNRAPVSNSLSVLPGQTITLTIPPNG